MERLSTLGSLVGVVALTACSATPTPPQSPKAAPQVESESASSSKAPRTEPDVAVKASFETSTAAVSPGSKFLVAAHFRIAEGYRLSWVNPGDVGKRIAIEFRAPEGFEVSAPMFPGPTKFNLPDGYVSYGYDGETAVFAEISTPVDISPDEVFRFELSAKWLACKGTCLKEGVEAYFELVSSPSEVSQGFEAPLPRFLQRIPQPVSGLDEATLEWREPGTLAIRARGVTWKDFFPAELSQPRLSSMSFGANESELILRFDRGVPGSTIQGVLLAEISGQPRYLAVNETLPSNDEAP